MKPPVFLTLTCIFSPAHRAERTSRKHFATNIKYTEASQVTPRRLSASGFTLIENLVALTVAGLFASTAVYTLLCLNRWSTRSRLEVLAGAAAQDKISEALGTPWSFENLTMATGTQGVTFNYLDPSPVPTEDDKRKVSGTVFTTTSVVVAKNGSNRVFLLTGTVRYSFHGTTYNMPFSTARARDDI